MSAYQPPGTYGAVPQSSNADLAKIEESLDKDIKFVLYKWIIIIVGVLRAISGAYIVITSILGSGGIFTIIESVIDLAILCFLLIILWNAYDAFRNRNTKQQAKVCGWMRIYFIVTVAYILYSNIIVDFSISGLIVSAVFGMVTLALFYYLADITLKVFEKRDKMLGME